MLLNKRLLIPLIAWLFLLASCNSAPRHARFVPKDALMVLGLHTGEMRKELAWSAITGSNLMDNLQKSLGSDEVPAMLKDLNNAGIDFKSTLYFYAKRDTRFSQGARIAAVLPVTEAGKVTAYLQKHYPGIIIRDVKDRKEAIIDGKVYIGWNDEVLIAMNGIVNKVQRNEPNPAPFIDSTTGQTIEDEPIVMTEDVADPTATAAEMDSAFNPRKDASIAGNGRFKDLESEGHDITMWLAYDAMSDMYGNGMDVMGMMGNAIWKGSAMTTGIDFEKGRVDGKMRYYASDSMRQVFKELGKENVDEDMLRRLPARGLHFAAGYHLAPKAIRMLLDKMGMSGMANLALMSKGTSVDEILGAFAGDMVVSLNNFRVETRIQEIDSALRDFDLKPYPVNSPKMDYVFAMKIGDRAKMTKLMNFITSSELLRQTAPNVYTVPDNPGAPTLVVGEKYVAVSSNVPDAQAFLKEGAARMPDAVKAEIAGHPSGMWADVRSLIGRAIPLTTGNSADSAAFVAMQRLFTTFTGHGGEFKRDATEYTMTLGFANKEENSMLQLFQLAQQLSTLNKQQQVVLK